MKLIDADALKEKIQEIVETEMPIDEKWAMGLRYSLKLIDNAPTVEIATKLQPNCNNLQPNCNKLQGEWVHIHTDFAKYHYKCSICGRQINTHGAPLSDYPFCHCGADMRGAESHLDNTPTVAINKDFYKEDKSNPINRSDLFQ